MKILLTTLNSKYIHTSLALKYLHGYCKDRFENMTIEEYTINHHTDYILGEIYKGNYDMVCFSCYIWNISMTMEIVKNLKKVNPNQKIILGGPEVSFDPLDLMKREDAVDYIIFGEGEETFEELLNYLVKGKGNLKEIRGIVYRDGEEIFKNEERPLIKDLGSIPSLFTEDLEGYENKIIYYESSRGCPHNCRYCLSSTIKGVRFFPLDRVKKDLGIFLKNGVKQVKFVDRTFNAKKAHSLEIMKYIVENDNGHTNFHFEITADVLDEEILAFLSTVREGVFQFEVGVQTTYEKTMKSIDRRVDFSILSKVVKEIASFKNIHLHLDLIAGLPYEGYATFKNSFDDVYDLKPEKLQLGFLKLLKGSGIRQDKDLHGYVFREEAPYEVLENKYISFKEILRLKMIEEMVEIYYNGLGFKNVINFILTNFYEKPSDFYEELGTYWERKGHHHMAHGKNSLYEVLLNFYDEKHFENREAFEEILKFDYLSLGKSSLSSCFSIVEMNQFNQRIHAFLQDEGNIKAYLPKYIGLPAKKIIKKVHFENFKYNVLKIINDPTMRDISEEKVTVLFDYELDRKIFAKSKYAQVNI